MKTCISVFLIWAAMVASFQIGRWDVQRKLTKNTEQERTLIGTLIDETVVLRSGMAEAVIWQMQDGSVWSVKRDGNVLENPEIILK